MAQQLLTPAEWAKQFDARRLARNTGGAVAFDPTKDTTGFANIIAGSEETQQRLGIGRDDISYTVGGSNENGDFTDSYYTLSERAAKQFQDTQVSHHVYDGRGVTVLRDKDGKVKYVSTPGDKLRSSFDKFADTVVIGGISAGLGGLGVALGGLSGTAATIGSGAIRGAASAGMTGGDVLRGAVMGGASAALPQIPGIKGLPSYAQSAATSSLATALRGGNLRDVLTSGAMGAAGSGVSSGLGAAGITNPLMQSMARNILMSRMRQAIVPTRK